MNPRGLWEADGLTCLLWVLPDVPLGGGRCHTSHSYGGRGAEAHRERGPAPVRNGPRGAPGDHWAGRPHLIPVTFALDGDRIYTVVDAKPKTTTNLRRLRNIGADPRVAVLADHYEDDWDALWWARADGLATILSRPADMAGPLELLAARYRQYRAQPPGGPLIRIQAERWTGWAASPG